MFTIEEFAAKFKTKAWTNKDLWKPNSEFRKFLLSLPGTVDGELSLYDVLCLGLLWCQGDNYNKAEQLFEYATPLGQANNSYSRYSEDLDGV